MKKIRRNDPCPCGSGKKFKHCHIGREDELWKSGIEDFTPGQSAMITSLPQVWFGRSREFIEQLDLPALTGSRLGIRLIDLGLYLQLGFSGRNSAAEAAGGSGGLMVNVFKTRLTDPDNVYLAISPRIGDSAMIHQLAHALDFMGGSGLMPGFCRPLSYDLGIPSEHLDHPSEFAGWYRLLADKFQVQPDADDAIILFLYEHGKLISGKDISNGDQLLLKKQSENMMSFLNERASDIDEMIQELPGYLGSRANHNK
ncbi:MAG: SEC-C domain-containing protein [Desulfatiglandaceae bacterium]